ncbi:MAG: acyl-CoA dehydrogenase, partial [Deltaproteobacteria bacterium]|nr:acyl-CoA dehydrogenase [Deltaproteobacteria bacterium]
MHFEHTDKVKMLQDTLLRFMDEYVYPAEPVAQQQIEESGDPHHMPKVIEELKAKAKEIG